MITPGLATELDLLTEALDLSGTDVAETMLRLAADAHTAVASYLGLSVRPVRRHHHHAVTVRLTVLEEHTDPDDIRTSLLVPLSSGPGTEGISRAAIALILYAATPGAFIDLAADLSWITGRTLAEFSLDAHLTLPSSHTEPSPLATMSTINQALGVLIGRGAIPEQAERDLCARAVSAGIEPVGAATLILAGLRPPEPEPA